MIKQEFLTKNGPDTYNHDTREFEADLSALLAPVSREVIDFAMHVKNNCIKTTIPWGNWLVGSSNIPVDIDTVYKNWLASRQPEAVKAEPTHDDKNNRCYQKSNDSEFCKVGLNGHWCKECSELDPKAGNVIYNTPQSKPEQPDCNKWFSEELERRWPVYPIPSESYNWLKSQLLNKDKQ